VGARSTTSTWTSWPRSSLRRRRLPRTERG
jgi:hypothetical protein